MKIKILASLHNNQFLNIEICQINLAFFRFIKDLRQVKYHLILTNRLETKFQVQQTIIVN